MGLLDQGCSVDGPIEVLCDVDIQNKAGDTLQLR